jgi:hypothetical protein
MEIMGYSGHVRVSSKARGNSRGLEKRRAVLVHAKRAA